MLPQQVWDASPPPMITRYFPLCSSNIIIDYTFVPVTMTNDEDGKRSVFGIEKFARQKGVAKGLHQFRERKEKKRLETAKSLRTYQKAMKREGFEPGIGASRKRMDDNEERNAVEETTPDLGNSSSEKATAVAKRQKTGSEFYNASHQSNQRFRRNEDREAQIQSKERERKQALWKRRQRHGRLSARTKKGQPVMKNIVHDILDKLQRETKADAPR